MLSIPHAVLAETCALINRVQIGLLINYDIEGGEHLWIGTSVVADSEGTLCSQLCPDHDICARVAAWPFVRWQFYDEANACHLIVDGTASLVPGPLWQRMGRLPPAVTDQPFTALITTMSTVRQFLPDDASSCRVVLPLAPHESRDLLRRSWRLGQPSQPSLSV